MRIYLHWVLLLGMIVLVSCEAGMRPKAPENYALSEAEEEIIQLVHKQLYENPSEARELIGRMLDSLDAGNPLLELILLKHKGSSYVLEANYTEAIKHYAQALAKAEDITNYTELANINNNLGVIYREAGNLKSAYLHFIEALGYYDLSGDQERKTGTLNNIGLVYLQLNNCEKAMTYFQDALMNHEQPRDTILMASIINNVALCYIAEEAYDQAHESLERSIFLSKKVSNTYGLCISYQILGKLLSAQNRYDEALDAYAESRDIALSLSLDFQGAISELGIAEAMIMSGHIHQALEVAYKVMDTASEPENLALLTGTHKILSQIYEQTGDYLQSLAHHKEHVNTQQEILNQTIIHQIYDVELNYLNQLNKMQMLELEKKELVISKKNNLLLFSMLTFFLLLAGLYLIYLNLRHRQNIRFQKTIIELTEKKAHAALNAEIQERKRIGQELHDSIGHMLSLAGLHASVLQKRYREYSEEKREELLDSLMKTIDDAFGEVRNISHNLAPSLLSERGLQGALKNISDRVNQSTRLKMGFQTFGLNGKLDNLIENTLFRTIQEIVNNTIKHSQASELNIHIAQGSSEITLIAEDNGRGFDAADIEHSGSGLANMKSRIENLKGSLFIDSNSKRGTIISILIPLN